MIKKTLVISFGLVLLLVGLASLILPILPGLLFLIVGAIMLASVYQPFDQRISRVVIKYPKINHVYLKIQNFLEKIFR